MNKQDSELDRNEDYTSPYVLIDQILDRLGEETNPKRYPPLIVDFAQAILATQESESFEQGSDPLVTLFEGISLPSSRRFVAICIVRLLSSNSRCLPPQHSIRAFNLLDDRLSDLYAIVKLTPKEQNYVKESQLVDLLQQTVAKLDEAFTSLGGLSSLTSFRAAFLKVFRSTSFKALIYPFLPADLLEARLNGIFETVEDLSKRIGPSLLPAYQEAKAVLSQFEDQALAFGTIYSKNTLAELAHCLLTVVQEYFDASSASKPAQIEIRPICKKYPLHQVNRIFALGFEVINNGPGIALDVTVELESGELKLEKTRHYLGNIEPASILLDFGAETKGADKQPVVYVKCTWTNFDGTIQEIDDLFDLESQKSGVDWSCLELEDPYSLEPVTTETELVGRTKILNELNSYVRGKGIGSAFVFGQKRVGKTSIVKTLATSVTEMFSETFLVIYLEAGDYLAVDATTTVERLGRKLCQEIKYAQRKFSGIDIPDFKEGALSPLSDFLREVLYIAESTKILFILDEFDTLPKDLYKSGGVGDAFFQTLRSISAKASFGFILVGSETMEYIIDSQGMALNKFNNVSVDYFDKERHWSDFRDLVLRPVDAWLEIADEAFVLLYEQSAGNPFFTKLICRELFRLMVQRRDCHVTRREVEEAVKIALNLTGVNSVQHFWMDGIVDDGAKADETSMIRRRVLLALVDSLRKDGVATQESIIECAKTYDVANQNVTSIVKDFVRREVLVKDAPTLSYHCRIPFFEQWLKEKGPTEIITTFPDAEAIAARRSLEDQAYVRSEEIVKLVKLWPTYKGKHITEDNVRAWLSQFDDNQDQRLMFTILQHVKFFEDGFVRSKLREAHGIVGRSVVRKALAGRVFKTNEVLVSYLDSPGKSGAVYAKLYADENKIYYNNVVERKQLKSVLAKGNNIKAVIFVDDFLGTGNTVENGLKELHGEISDSLISLDIEWYFVAICGFPQAKERIQKTVEKIQFPVDLHICQPFDDGDRLFHSNSKAFPDPHERARAMEIARVKGSVLLKDAPFGYGDCQTAVVFETNCPNNDIAILWSDAREWMPLFKRL